MVRGNSNNGNGDTVWIVLGVIAILVIACVCWQRRGRDGRGCGCGKGRRGKGNRDDIQTMRRKIRKLYSQIKCNEREICKKSACLIKCCPPPPVLIPTPFFVEHTAFVDGVYGNNTSARLERPDLPYRTIQAAVTAAATRATTAQQWQVQIRPDTYSETVTMASYVDLVGVAPHASLLSSASTQVPEVTIVGRLIVPATLVGPVRFQNVAVYSTNQSSLLVAGGTGSGTGLRNITATHSLFVAEYTASTGDRLGVELNETTLINTSVTLDDVGVLLIDDPSEAVNGVSESVIYSEVRNFRLLRSRVVLEVGLPLSSDMASFMVFIENGTNTTNMDVLSDSNEYATVLNNDFFWTSTAVYLFYLQGSIQEIETTPLVNLGSEADVWFLSSNVQGEEVPVLVSVVTVAGTAEQDILSSTVQALAVRITTLGVGAFTTLNILGTPNTDSSAYFRGMVINGVTDILSPVGFVSGAFTLLQTDVMVDDSQTGQFFPGTLTIITGTTYTVDIVDAIVQFEGALASTITLPPASEYPGRTLIIKNDSLVVVTLSPDITGGANLQAGEAIVTYSDGDEWQVVSLV